MVGSTTALPNGLTVRGIPIFGGSEVPSSFGNYFFVDDSGSDDNDGTDSNNPLATIDAAVGKCTANQGDMIVVKEGHAESLAAAADLALDVAGITIVGLGHGNDRPTVTLGTAVTADVDVDAADITVINLIFDLTGIDAITAGIDVNAAGFTMLGCRVVMSDSGGQAILGILTDAAADRLTIDGCDFIGSSDAGPTAAIRFVGNDEGTVRNSRFTGDYSVGNISMLTTAPTDVLIENNDFNNLNAVDVNVEGIAAATGTIRRNTCRIATDGQTTWLNSLGDLQLHENYGVNNSAETGMLIGTASS